MNLKLDKLFKANLPVGNATQSSKKGGSEFVSLLSSELSKAPPSKKSILTENSNKPPVSKPAVSFAKRYSKPDTDLQDKLKSDKKESPKTDTGSEPKKEPVSVRKSRITGTETRQVAAPAILSTLPPADQAGLEESVADIQPVMGNAPKATTNTVQAAKSSLVQNALEKKDVTQQGAPPLRAASKHQPLITANPKSKLPEHHETTELNAPKEEPEQQSPSQRPNVSSARVPTNTSKPAHTGDLANEKASILTSTEKADPSVVEDKLPPTRPTFQSSRQSTYSIGDSIQKSASPKVARQVPSEQQTPQLKTVQESVPHGITELNAENVLPKSKHVGEKAPATRVDRSVPTVTRGYVHSTSSRATRNEVTTQQTMRAQTSPRSSEHEVVLPRVAENGSEDIRRQATPQQQRDNVHSTEVVAHKVSRSQALPKNALVKETFVNVAKSKEQVLPEVDAKSEGVTARIVPSANRPSTAKDLTARSNSDLTLSTPTTVRPKDQNTLNNSHAKILGDTPKSAASENTKTTATEPVRDRTSAFTTPVTPEKVVATKDGKAPATHQARPWTPTSHRNIVDEVVEHYTNRATTPESDGTYIADSQLEPNERPVTKPEIGASSVRASDRKEVPARQSQAKSVNQKLSQPEKQNSQTGEVVLEHLAEVKTETKQSVQASRVETQKPVLEETRVSSDNQIATTAPIDRKGNSQPKVTNDTREARSFARAGQPPVKLPAQPLVEPAPLVHATEKKGDVVRIVTNEQNESSEMMSPKEVLGYKFVPKDSRAPQQTSANAGNAVVSNEVESDTKIDALRYNRATQNSQSRVAHTVLLDSKDRDGAKHNQEVIAPTTKTSELPAVSVPKMPIANDAPELLSEPEVARGIETTHESSEYGIGKAAPQYKVVSTHVQKPIEAIRVPETAAAKLAAKSEVHSPPASESKQSVNNAASEPVVNSKSSANSALHSISSLKPVKTATPKENHTSLEHMFAGSEEATEILLNDKSDVSAKVSPTAREVRNTSPTSMLNKAPLSGPTTKYAEPVISATANSSETKQAPLPVTSRAAKAMETIVPKNTDIRENAETPRMDMQKVSVDSQKGENRNNVSFAPLPKNVNTVSKSENIVTETKPADLPKQNTAPLESTSPEARNVTKNTLNNLRAPAPALVRDAVQIATPNVSPDSRTIVPLFAQPQPFAQSVRNDSSSSAKPEPKAERPVQAVNANEAERSPQSTNQNGGDASSQNTERDHSQAGFKPIVESSPQNIQHTSSARTQSMQQHALNESLKAALQQALDMSRKRLVEPNELRLSVPLGELGTMDIDVVRETEKISIRIGADHKALALLEDQKPYLTQWLRDQGYPVEQLDLSPRSNGNPNSGLTGSNTSSQDSQTSRSMRSESSLTGQTIEMADSFQPAARPTNSGQHVWTA